MELFNSRNKKYKTPFGAVSEGTQVHLRVCLPRYISASAVDVLFHNEHTGEDEIGNMFWCGMEGSDNEWWEVDFTPSTAGLWFYTFKLECVASAKCIGRTFGSVGELTANPQPFQLTVYERGFETPDWLAGGIIYQIFPDRFACSGEQHENVPNDRVMHEKWDEEIIWWPNEHGKIVNNDYFGGDLKGITENLDRLVELGVSCLYLNPIFESQENHRYSTACYERIDPLLGDEEDFKKLCDECHKRGIKVILDGVFSHTGSDSMYFNKNGRYDTVGAYNSKQSPYYSWYGFSEYPDKYHGWWGFETLPEVNENDPAYTEYICGENGILRRWLRLGADGWRLDVADELPDEFLDNLRKAVKAEKPDALIMGEVWEDASNKIAYSVRKRYFGGRQLDTVMNYVFKDAIVGLVTGWDAKNAMECILSVMENYPPQVIPNLMNLISSHDTMRALTLFGGEPLHGRDRAWQANEKLHGDQYGIGRNLLKMATVMQYTLPGVPSIYYGDEAGLDGYCDPFNRRCYPWGHEDTDLIAYTKTLAKIRKMSKCFVDGRMKFLKLADDYVIFARYRHNSRNAMAIVVNRSDKPLTIDVSKETFSHRYTSFSVVYGKSNGNCVTVEPFGFLAARVEL